MGSRSKGGSQATQHVSATIACLVGWGPVYGLRRVLLNGETVWEGPLLRGDTTNPVNLSTKYGTIRFYWGTEDQTADATLNSYEEHPPYRGLAYAVFVDFDHGQSTNAYNAEFILMAAPAQTVVSGGSAAEDLDDAFTVNPIVLAAEILTSPAWLGLDDEELDDASFQAVADDVQSEIPDGAPAERSASAISPLYDDAEEMRKVLVDALAIADAWLRVNADGLIECGRWRRDGSPPSVTTLTFDDLSDWPVVEGLDHDERPNSFAVEFTDSDALHKDAKITVDDLASLGDQALRRATLRAPHLITYDQALRAGQEAVRRSTQPGTWSGAVRATRAITPEGDPLLPGDYVIVPVSAPGQTLKTRLLRIETVVRPRNATRPVQISGTFDPPAVGTLAPVAAEAVADQVGVILPPLAFWRVLLLPYGEDDDPAVNVLAARPHPLALGVDAYYDSDPSGDYPLAGKQPAFALPVSLVAGIDSAATTVRVAIIPTDGDGISARRDEHILRDWSGGETEGRDDELLLILLKKSGDYVVPFGDRDWVEVLSVAGAPTLVATDTYDVPVLRGRRSTEALDFSAGSFPDAWSEYEGWIIPRAQLEAITHGDFADLIASGSPGCFRLGAYSGHSVYDPADAYAEAQRRTSESIALEEFANQPDGATWVPQQCLFFAPGNSPPTRYEDLLPRLQPSVTYECRTRGGTASLCGYDEFCTPSTPPKKYRTATPVYSESFSYFSDGACTNQNGSTATTSTSGANTFDSATCVETIGAVLHHSVNGDAAFPTPAWGCGASDCSATTSATQTVNTLTWSGACCAYTAPGTLSRIATGGGTWTLSDEDTEDDAIARLVAAEAWTDWEGISSFPGCQSSYDARTAGFTFDYQEAEFRISATDLTVALAVIDVYITKTDLTTGDVVGTVVQTYEVAPTAGAVSFDLDLPIERGFSHEIRNVVWRGV